MVESRYQLLEPLDQSPSGVTWLARDTHLGARCGIKLPVRTDTESALRLLREGEVLAHLTSPHLANPHLLRLMDQGRLAGDARPALVLEWLEGEPLDVHLDRVGRLPTARATALVRQVLLGLRTLHGQGLVHRDLCAARLFLSREAGGREVLKIIDFGSTARASTRPPPGTGQPTPEGSERCDARADLYAVGTLFYRMIAGQAPFSEAEALPGRPTSAEGAQARVQWLQTHSLPTRPSISLPDRLWGVLLTLLERRPEDRYRSADAVLQALDAAAGDTRAEAEPLAPAPPAHARFASSFRSSELPSAHAREALAPTTQAPAVADALDEDRTRPNLGRPGPAPVTPPARPRPAAVLPRATPPTLLLARVPAAARPRIWPWAVAALTLAGGLVAFVAHLS